MSLSKVSIIVPVYNAEPYVDRCLQSIKSQTYNNLEVIMVDDGSTDNSGELIDEIAASSHNVIALHQANQGPAAARHAGVMKAAGDYVMFLDSDDTLPHDAVEFMVTTSRRENLDAFYGMLYRIINDKTLTLPPRDFEGVVGSDEMLRNILDPTFVYHAAICFSRRELWDDDMFCKERNLPSEDILTNIKLALKCHRIGLYNKPVYNYHLVSTSLTMTGRYFSQEHFKNFFNELEVILQENGKAQLLRDDVRIMEIHTFGFYITKIVKDEWYHEIMSYDVHDYPRKIKTLHRLLRYPALLKTLVATNRWLKKLVN